MNRPREVWRPVRTLGSCLLAILVVAGCSSGHDDSGGRSTDVATSQSASNAGGSGSQSPSESPSAGRSSNPSSAASNSPDPTKGSGTKSGGPDGAVEVPIAVHKFRDGGRQATAVVTIHGKKYAFIIDTGAAQTVVDSSVVATLGLKSAGAATSGTSLGCSTSNAPVHLDNWQLGAISLPSTVAVSVRTGLVKQTVGGLHIAGLFGADLLSTSGVVSIDFTHQRLIFGGKAPSGGKSVQVQVNRVRGAVIVFAPVTIHGRALGFIVDTGATTSTVDQSATSVLGLKAVGKPTSVQAVSCKVPAQRVRLDDWKVGDVSLPASVAISSKSKLSEQSHGAIIGLLGADVLAHFGTVTFDFDKDTLTLGGQR